MRQALLTRLARSFSTSSVFGMAGHHHHLPEIIEAALPPHHRATKTLFHGRFDNPWDTWEERTFSHVLRWTHERRKAGLPSDGHLSYNLNPTPADFAARFLPAEIDAAALAAPRPARGHARRLGPPALVRRGAHRPGLARDCR